MFQRIQSIYLLISLIAWTLLFFVPILGFVNEAGESWHLYPRGIKTVDGGTMVIKAIPMLILFLISEHLALIALVAYRKRMSQLRMTVLNMVFQILSYGIIGVYAFQGKKLLNATTELQFWTILPLIAAISSYFAFRGIRRDMLLLRAQDRLR